MYESINSNIFIFFTSDVNCYNRSLLFEGLSTVPTTVNILNFSKTLQSCFVLIELFYPNFPI